MQENQNKVTLASDLRTFNYYTYTNGKKQKVGTKEFKTEWEAANHAEYMYRGKVVMEEA